MNCYSSFGSQGIVNKSLPCSTWAMDEEQLLTLGRIIIGLSDGIKSSMLARVKAMGCSVQYALEVVGIQLKLSLDEDVVMMLDCVPITYDLRHVWSNVMNIDVLSGKVLLNEIESMPRTSSSVEVCFRGNLLHLRRSSHICLLNSSHSSLG